MFRILIVLLATTSVIAQPVDWSNPDSVAAAVVAGHPRLTAAESSVRAARERIAEGVTLVRTPEGEASLEIPMASREEGQAWLRRLASFPGVAVLLTDSNGDEVLGRGA